MPRKPKRPCAYPGCPNTSNSQYCEAHTKLMDKHYYKFQRDPAINKRYGAEWRAIRSVYVAKNPLCEQCYKQGRLTPVQEVHHIKALSRGGTHDSSNLMSLCKSCHSRITALEGDRWKRNKD